MGYSGCYSLDFYCDNKAHIKFPEAPCYGIPLLELNGFTRADCIKQAKKLGWKIKYKTKECYCPECNKNFKLSEEN